MKAYPEAYSRELDRLLVMGEVPAPRPGNEYYTIRSRDGRLLAAGVCWTSRLHPTRIRFYIAVEELYQRRGYGTMIFDRMRADHPGAKWKGCADLENDIAEWWLRGLGFEFSYRSYWLDAMCVDLVDRETDRLPIVSYNRMNREQQDRLVSMIWTDYADKHRVFDPLNEEIDAETFRNSVLCEVDEDAAVCLIEEGEILAYAVCASVDDWTTGVKYVGSRMADKGRFRRFLTAFVNRAFERKGGLLIEADSFDEDAMTLLRLFGDLPDDSYDVYVSE